MSRRSLARLMSVNGEYRLGALREARQQRGLAQVELADRLAEVGPGGRLDPIGPAPEVDGVEVHLQDLVLAVPVLDLRGQLDLLHLPRQRALRRQEESLGELLGNGASALLHLGGREVAQGGARHPLQADRPVLIELGVLDVQDRTPHELRNARERDEDAEFLGKRGERFAPACIQDAGLAGLEDLEPIEGRQILLRVRREAPAKGRHPKTEPDEQHHNQHTRWPNHAIDLSVHSVNGTTESHI